MKRMRLALCGAAAGIVNGLLGTGGGLLLVPMLTAVAGLEDDRVFPTSVSIVFPICIISMILSVPAGGIPFLPALPYLLGSIPGGLLAGCLSGKIPVKWLHRILGLLILWGGVRYLW